MRVCVSTSAVRATSEPADEKNGRQQEPNDGQRFDDADDDTRYHDGVAQFDHAAKHALASIGAESNLLGSIEPTRLCQCACVRRQHSLAHDDAPTPSAKSHAKPTQHSQRRSTVSSYAPHRSATMRDISAIAAAASLGASSRRANRTRRTFDRQKKLAPCLHLLVRSDKKRRQQRRRPSTDQIISIYHRRRTRSRRKL